MRVLITGAAGFVGRAFTRALWDEDLRLLDVADPGLEGDWTQTDARDYFRRSDERFDLVVHLAAVVGGRQTIEGEPLKLAVDLSIDAEMFGWALRTRPGRVVYYSSSAAYPVALQTGDPPHRLAEEDLNLEELLGAPDLSYGWAKLSGEMLARWAEAEGLRVHVFRPFSGYGVDQDESYPFRAFLERARRRQDPFEVWGDGLQVRDFVHIDDVVDGTLAAIEQDYVGPLNLCTGRPTTLLELADLVSEAAGYRPDIELKPEAPRGVRYRVGDPSRAFEVWEPAVSLEEGIARSVST